MKTAYNILPSGLEDIVEIYNYIGAERPNAAEKFFREVFNTIDNLAALPEMGKHFLSKNPKLNDIRFFPIHSFPRFLVFYRIKNRKLQVIHIYHDARNINALFELNE